MDHMDFITSYWESVAAQDALALPGYFHTQARIRWHNTNEDFSVDEFIIANCQYPGSWKGQVERVCAVGDTLVSVVRVHSATEPVSLHAVSFFHMKEGKILSIDEYWGDDGPAPQWRLDKHIGTPIR